jgi:hypothetical protein
LGNVHRGSLRGSIRIERTLGAKRPSAFDLDLLDLD